MTTPAESKNPAQESMGPITPVAGCGVVTPSATPKVEWVSLPSGAGRVEAVVGGVRVSGRVTGPMEALQIERNVRAAAAIQREALKHRTVEYAANVTGLSAHEWKALDDRMPRRMAALCGCDACWMRALRTALQGSE